MAQMITVKVIESFRAAGYRLRPRTIVELPDHIVAALPPGTVEVLGNVKETNVDTIGRVTNLPNGLISLVKLPSEQKGKV